MEIGLRFATVCGSKVKRERVQGRSKFCSGIIVERGVRKELNAKPQQGQREMLIQPDQQFETMLSNRDKTISRILAALLQIKIKRNLLKLFKVICRYIHGFFLFLSVNDTEASLFFHSFSLLPKNVCYINKTNLKYGFSLARQSIYIDFQKISCEQKKVHHWLN